MAKVRKLKMKSKGNSYTYWMLDVRSIGLTRITINPKTNKRFESKKEAEIYLAELLSDTSKGISIKSNDLLVDDLCDVGIKEIMPGSNSGEKIFSGGGSFIKDKKNDLDNANLSASHFESLRFSLSVFNQYNNEKRWLNVNAKKVLNQILVHCKNNAINKESDQLKEASAWTTFNLHLRNLKSVSTWIAEEYDCVDVFGKIITKTKNKKTTFVKPVILQTMQKDSRDVAVDLDRLKLLRQWMEESFYIYKGKFVSSENIATERRRTIFLQFDLLMDMGLRIGEALALTWDDVKFYKQDGKEITGIRINKQYDTRAKTLKATKGTKANSVYGDVELYTSVLTARLKEHKDLQTDKQSALNLIFPNLKGNYDSRKVLNRVMKKGCNALWPNEPSKHISPHTLRHAMATHFAKKHGKNNMGILSAKLRHESGQLFTEKRYVSAIEKTVDEKFKEAQMSAEVFGE
jgi:integrase